MEASLDYFTSDGRVVVAKLGREPASVGAAADDGVIIAGPDVLARHAMVRWFPAQATWAVARQHEEGRLCVNNREVLGHHSLESSGHRDVWWGRMPFSQSSPAAKGQRSASDGDAA